jgi:hypothetical protein
VVGRLLTGGVAGKDVNGLLSICHLLLLQDTTLCAYVGAAFRRTQGCYSVVAGSPIKLQISDCRLQI